MYAFTVLIYQILSFKSQLYLLVFITVNLGKKLLYAYFMFNLVKFFLFGENINQKQLTEQKYNGANNPEKNPDNTS